MERHCLTIDLRPSPELIAEYIRYHENVWPEVLQSLRDAGVIDMEIYEQDGRGKRKGAGVGGADGEVPGGLRR
jgi:L-rhamnose mutarotase